MMDYQQAEHTAEKLLHIGTLTYRQIAQTTDLPMWHIKALAQDILWERDSDLRYLRRALRITEQSADSANMPEMASAFTRCISDGQKLIYNRAISDNEAAQLTDYAVNLSCQQLQSMLIQLSLLSELSDMQLICAIQIFMDSMYSQIMRNGFDDENSTVSENFTVSENKKLKEELTEK